MTDSLRIAEAREPQDLDAIRALFKEYESVIGFCLCFQDFDAELATLPGKYAAPRGRLFIAKVNDEPAGCVALRPLSDTICEMKRLFVRPGVQGHGLGRKLCELIIGEAKAIGYTAMRLDTVESMAAAITLYRSVGFKPIEAYTENPIKGAMYLELAL